jgi:hypothetical protein
MPKTFSRTNRTVQGWIFEGITNKQDTYEIHVCTEAHFTSAGSESNQLNLQQKYYRALVEAATIVAQRELSIKNKQFDVDCADLQRKLEDLRKGESAQESYCRGKDIALGYSGANPQNDSRWEEKLDDLVEEEAVLKEIRRSISALESHMREHGCTPTKDA